MIPNLLKRLRTQLARIAQGRKWRELIRLHHSSRLNYGSLHLQPGVQIQIGSHSLVDGTLVTERPGARIIIGDRTFMNGTLISAESIELGSDVLIAWGVTIVDHDSHALAFTARAQDVVDWARAEKDWSHVRRRPVRIGDKVWIGFNAIILKGVHVGDGAIVGAGSVVTKDVPPWTVVAGNPARVIRELALNER